MRKDTLYSEIIKTISDIASLAEADISDNHPLVLNLKEKLTSYENLFGESVHTKLLFLDFTFDNLPVCIELINKSIALIKNTESDIHLILDSISELEFDLENRNILDQRTKKILDGIKSDLNNKIQILPNE